jgi:hypothetical protein
MMAEWVEEQAKINAAIKAMNNTIKKQCDEIIARGNESTRKNTINKFMGQFMADMTPESRRMVIKWTRSEIKDLTDPESALKADNIEEAYAKYDWLYVFDDTLKAYIMNEYSSQMTQTERAKVIYNVISGKRKTELALNANEEGKSHKGKCHVCGQPGHKMKCWYYDPSMTLEDNKKAVEQKMKEKQAAKREKVKEAESKSEAAKTPPKKENPAEVHKGTIAIILPKEKTGMCLVRDAMLYCEQCNMTGVRPGQVDFVYDLGTMSGVMGDREIKILRSIEEEDILIETVTGEQSISKLYGNTIFGRTRTLKGRSRSVLVSQYSMKRMYQVINPDEYSFISKGWEHNPATRGKVWYLPRDEERYGDKLLHFTVSIKQAKCFAVSKEKRFYDPMKVPEEQEHEKFNQLINAMHVRFSHAGASELKRNFKTEPEWY